jgi:aminobenzoyl-glutamate utilization protein B
VSSSLPPHLVATEREIEASRLGFVALSDQIGGYAEPGLREYRSAGALRQYLAAAGFRVAMGVAGMPTAFVAEAGRGRPVIGLMCEYDATPGDSQQPVPHMAPIAHDACGFPDLHNGIGAASAGAAAVVAETLAKSGRPGTIRVFGTPAEKICVGKPFMARDGLYDGLDAVIAWHPRPYTTLEWDSGPGCYEAAIFDFDGVGAYASAPWAGVSALDGMTLMNVVVQFMREHIPRQYLASVNEIITSGGQHPTSIPTHAQAWYVYRSPQMEGVAFVRAMLGRAAQAAAAGTGAKVSSQVVASTRPWLPNHAIARHCFRNLQLAGAPRFPPEMLEFGRQMLATLGLPDDEAPFDETVTDLEAGATREFAGGADDVNEFCWHAPTARIYVAHGLRTPRLPNWTGAALALTPAAHATVTAAARAIAYSAVDLVERPDVVEAARAEFEERLGRLSISPLLPGDARPPVDHSFPPHYPLGWRPPTQTEGGEASG